jgi:hypothetical protein
VSYGPNSSRHRLDIYRPSQALAASSAAPLAPVSVPVPVPVVIHVHGGGWQRGDKNNRWRGAPVAGEALSGGHRDDSIGGTNGDAPVHGAVTVCISYRLAPRSFFSVVFAILVFSPILAAIIKGVAAAFGTLADLSYAALLFHYVMPAWAVCWLAVAAITALPMCGGHARHPEQVGRVVIASSAQTPSQTILPCCQ